MVFCPHVHLLCALDLLPCLRPRDVTKPFLFFQFQTVTIRSSRRRTRRSGPRCKKSEFRSPTTRLRRWTSTTSSRVFPTSEREDDVCTDFFFFDWARVFVFTSTFLRPRDVVQVPTISFSNQHCAFDMLSSTDVTLIAKIFVFFRFFSLCSTTTGSKFST